MRPSGRQHRLLPLAAVVFGGGALVSGAIGRITADGIPPSVHGWIQLVYESAALLVLQPPAGSSTTDPATHNVAFSVARLSAVLFVVLGAGSVLLELYRPARDAWLRGRFWWARTRGHAPAVVIGLGSIGTALLRELRSAQPRRPVYAVAAPGAGLLSNAVRHSDALVIEGDATEPRVRARLDLRHASEVFIATEEDARDIAIAGNLLRDARDARFGRRLAPLHCFVHASTPSLAGALGSHRLLHDSRGEIAFQFFNLEEQAARNLLLADGAGLARLYPPDDVAYYIVLGSGERCQTVALQMGRLAHFRSSRRLRLTLISDADPRTFVGRHPGFAPNPGSFSMLAHRGLELPDKDAWSCRYWRPADPAWHSDAEDAVEYAVNAELLDASGAEGADLLKVLLDRIKPSLADERAGLKVRPALVVCFDDEARNLRCALWLREALEAARLDGPVTEPLPVYVYLSAGSGFAGLLDAAPEFKHSAAIRLHVVSATPPGGLYDAIVRPQVRELAARIHGAYREQAGGPAFDALSPALQASNVDAAAHLVVKQDALRRVRDRRTDEGSRGSAALTEAEIEMLARMEHNRWMAERLLSGFRIGEKRALRSGPVEHENRRRPSLLPWERLSQVQQSEALKDVSQVLALLGAAE